MAMSTSTLIYCFIVIGRLIVCVFCDLRIGLLYITYIAMKVNRIESKTSRHIVLSNF